jgi:Glycosyl hydrolases family 2, TIM barrel domain
LAVKDTPEPLDSAQLRAAFAEGLTVEGAEALLRARDTGLDWETATRAVAEGLAAHYGSYSNSPPIRPSRPPAWLLALVTIAAYVLLRPVLGLGHELAVAALALLSHVVVDTGVWEPLIRLSGLDPIYTGAAIRAAGGVQVAGLAVAAPIGSALHWLLPVVFLAPDQVASGAGLSMVAAPGAPALGRGLAGFGADVIWLTIGLGVFWRWRCSNWRLALLGLLIQAQIAINHLLDAHVGLADLNASGLPFALALAVPNGGWFTSGLATWPGETRDLVVGACLVFLGYALSVPLVWLALAGSRAVRRLRRHAQAMSVVTLSPRPRWSAVLGALSLALITAWSPIGALAVGNPNWQMTASALDIGSHHLSLMGGRSGRQSHSLRVAGATPVSIEHAPDGTWQYVVDGTAETIRGVGYNPQYAGLSPAERAAMYDRDFADMHRLGANSIEGWFETQFDSVTLDSAARDGIGVMMPFELNQDWDFTNPNVTASILDHVSAYVEKYKDHPAVRMWAPGNENLHRILYAHWVSQVNDPNARARAQAFAAFLPVLVDRIRQLDPNHPVVYRDAEDVYLPWITGPFSQTGVDRPWLVYGANVYSTARLQQIVSSWPNQWPGRPLLISEFAPGGVGPAERPLGFQQQWNVIRSRPDVVLGGLAYTWATNGPEDLDRVFGLVDPNGVPTDGALAALSAVYQSDGTAMADTPAAN